MSGDGVVVAYDSAASDIIAGDNNGTTDVFVYNAATGKTILISRNTAGHPANGPSLDPAISTSGRYVVYTSYATDIGGGSGTPADALVYRYNLKTGATMLVSAAPNGAYPRKAAGLPDVSATGRYVVYFSADHTLVTGDDNKKPDIFRWDAKTDKTVLVSTSFDGTGANGASEGATISRNGRWVAFQSRATDIVPFDGPNFGTDIYLWDATSEASTLVTTSIDTGPAHGSSLRPDISDNGRYIGFESQASDLVADMTQPLTQAYLYDRVAHLMTRVSTSYDDWPGGSTNSFVSVSADGSAVSYLSDRWDTVGDVLDPNVLVWARGTGGSSFVSTAANGTPGNNTSSAPSISADGDHIAFTSLARNLPHGTDNNKTFDAYVWTAPTP